MLKISLLFKKCTNLTSTQLENSEEYVCKVFRFCFYLNTDWMNNAIENQIYSKKSRYIYMDRLYIQYNSFIVTKTHTA